eukprot:1370351-Prymnesium_polylepis.1
MLHEAVSPRPSEVLPRLLLGNGESAREPRALQRAGVTHIVNATPDLPNGMPHLRYLRVAVDDSEQTQLRPHFDAVSDFIAGALGEARGGAVLVHCHQGISRSATLVLAFLMREHRMPLTDAFEFVMQRRWIRPNPGFLGELQMYEKVLEKRRQGHADAGQEEGYE